MRKIGLFPASSALPSIFASVYDDNFFSIPLEKKKKGKSRRKEK